MAVSSQVVVHQISMSIGLSTSVRLHESPVDLQLLIMLHAVWSSPRWHRLSSANLHFTIESPNFLFQFVIYLVEPSLSEGSHFLGVCLTSLGCVVAVYVVLILAGDHSLVIILEMKEEVCKI